MTIHFGLSQQLWSSAPPSEHNIEAPRHVDVNATLNLVRSLDHALTVNTPSTLKGKVFHVFLDA